MMSEMSGKATVLGFGGRAPDDVLSLLKESQIGCIVPERSQSIELALLEHHHRFLQNSGSSSKQLLIYALPTTIGEYLSFRHEADRVKTTVYNSIQKDEKTNQPTVVVVTSPSCPIDIPLVLKALNGDDDDDDSGGALASLSRLALSELSKLDTDLALPHFRSSNHTGDTVLVVGGGGREHALALRLAQSPLVQRVLCCPGNGGTADRQRSNRKIWNTGGNTKNETVLEIVGSQNVQMVVVGPEAPLVEGLIDELAEKYPKVKAFGPTKAASILEASKAFTKDFLQEHNIPTAKYRNFTDVNEALQYVQSLDPHDRQVVKASGLAAGKGVLLPTSPSETLAAVREIMADRAFGAAGDTCVIESFLVGPEASCLAFCDGKTAKLMPAAQDHKRALDGDQGLNTGGMGAYAPAPVVTPKLQKQIEEYCQKTVQKMAERGTPYVGVLYAGMMLTPNGPYVLEFNCRFGDPETQVVLPLLETDLYEVLTACCDGTLDQIDVRFRENTSAATVVCAAKGYPEKYPKGMEITGVSDANAIDNVQVYHAGTKLDDEGVLRCSGGRVLAVTGLGLDLKGALKNAYKGVDKIDFLSQDDPSVSLKHNRTDIAKGAIRERKLRLGVLGSTRGTALIPVMEACRSGHLQAEIVCVVSNKSDAPILDKGRSLGVTCTTRFISPKGMTRETFDAACTAELEAAGVEFVLLVGYMRILSKQFCDFWKGQCINVHPSLLPKHAGGMDLAVHQAVIDAGETESGCTIHQVTEDVDGGPIVVQKVVSVDPSTDTAESLKARVQPLEGPAFIEAIEKYTASHKEVISYADAGVSIDAGNDLVDLIKPACKATRRPGCDADLGGFGGLFDLAAAGYDASNTVLIGATDGVGTKLRIAQAIQCHETVGIDLVAMCVNDLIVAGGEPLFFLDYFATGKLDVNEAAAVVRGIAEGCRQAGCGLIGGETAEMPSMYAPGDYDLAGFSVGAVPRDRILPQGVAVGDVLLGLTSSGIHSNGFSLVRKLVAKEGLTFASPCPWAAAGTTIGESLLTPTRIYVKNCLPLIKKNLLKGMAHITGGGLLENLPRSLPDGVGARITGHPALPEVFRWMKDASGLDDSEMLRTFNCGIGMVLIVGASDVEEVKQILTEGGEEGFCDLGVLVSGGGVSVEGALA